MRRILHNQHDVLSVKKLLQIFNISKKMSLLIMSLFCFSSSLFAQVNITTSPESVSVSQDEIFVITVELNTDQNVDAAEVHMSFDPNILEVTNLSLPDPNPFPVPIIGAGFDNLLGVIDYAAGTFSSFPNTNIDLINIEFVALTNGVTELEFSGLPSKATFSGINILSEATGSTITVEVIDNTAPVITLIGEEIINLLVGDIYIEQGAIANDNSDGDISENIVIDGDIVNVNVEGEYVITYNVIDTSNNAAEEVKRTVIVSQEIINTYAITTNSGENGTISPSSTNINQGDNIVFTISPNPGYEIEDVVVNGISVGPVTTYEFVDVQSNSTINATFIETTDFQLCIACGNENLTAFGRNFIGDPTVQAPSGSGFLRSGGAPYSSNVNEIIGTTSPEEILLFKNEMYGGKTGTNNPVAYEIPVPDGFYQVDLYFAEVYQTAPGTRVFDVILEDKVILDEYDLLDPIKDGISNNHTAIVRTYFVFVEDGSLNVQVGPATVDNGKISGLCVTKTSNTNVHPVANLTNLQFEVGESISEEVDIQDDDDLMITFNNLPSSISFDASNNQLVGTPLVDELGEYKVNVIISDENSSPVTAEFIITIYPSGSDLPPAIASIDDVEIMEGASIETNIVVSDDNDIFNTSIIIYDKSNGGTNNPFLPNTTVPESAYTFTDNGNGNYSFVWNTLPGDGRSYLAEVTTDDGVNIPVIQTFSIDIAQPIPADILARTFTNPLPWYKSTSDSAPVAPFTVAIEDNVAQNVGYLDAGDYVEYLINVPSAGEYDIEFLAAKGNNGTTTISISEENNGSYSVLGNVTVAKSAWQTYLSYFTSVNFENSGLQTIRLDFSAGVNIKNFIFSQSPIASCNVAYRINAGGPLNGVVGGDFEADQSLNEAGGAAETGVPSIYYKGAIDKTYGSNVALVSNTTGYPDAIFQTERHIDGGSLMNWEFPANGVYEVNLLFNENWTGESADPRVFDVEIEDEVVLDNYRPSVAAGGFNIAKVETFTVEVTDGTLNIDFKKGTQNPSIKGFSICLISELENTPPLVNIDSPVENITVVRGMDVNLIGTAVDAQDGEISDLINWSSGDARFTTSPLNGIGSNITGQFITPGTQTLTATVEDSDFETANSEIEIEVSGPEVLIDLPLENAELNSTNVRLEWTGNDVLFELTEHYHIFVNPADINNIDSSTRISTASQIGQEFWDLTASDGIIDGENIIVIVVADPTHAEFTNIEAKDIVNFTVTLPDDVPPEITLLDEDPLIVELGSPYSNLGASAFDEIDGDLTNEIVISGDIVDVNTVGDYSIIYNVSDASGNAATEVIQTVSIIDSVAPVITCPADIITSTDVDICGVNLVLTNASVIDLSDDITYDAFRSDGLLMSEPYGLGETMVTWTAIDGSGNISEQCIQKITVIDEIAPDFACPSNININSLNGNPMIVEIIQPLAIDACSDQNLTVIGTRNDGQDINDAYPVGVTQIEWKVLDEANNFASCIQTVTINFTGSSENNIEFFTFQEQSEPEIIDYVEGTVDIKVAPGTDITALEANFGISTNASVSPNLGEVLDFTDLVNYTVTAEDGTQKIWTVRVTVEEDPVETLVVNTFTLVNADTDQDIMILTEGILVNSEIYENTNLAIRADTSSDVASVQLILSGVKNKTQSESVSPFSLYGDNAQTGNYEGELFTIGNYTITATAYSNTGLTGVQGDVKSINFQFIDQDPLCIDFDVSVGNKLNPSGCNINDGSITLNATGFSGSLSYDWSHDNNLTGSSANGLGAGTYTVMVTDINGCFENLSITLSNPDLPVVTLESFDDVLTTDSPISLIGGSPLGGEYSGIGVNNNTFDPSIGVGEYTIVYTFTDSNGCSDSTTQSITVNAPVDNTTLFILNAEDDSVLYSLTDGLEIMKSDIGDTPLGIIYNADLEPGSVTFKLSGPLSQTKTEGPSAPYSLFGDIGVDIQGKSFPIGDYTLSTTTSSGMSQTVEFSIVNGPPANVAPVVVLSGDPDGSVPFKMNFTGSGSFDGDGTITNYSWDFGDGNTSSVTDPSHTYALGGDYTVTLTLTDDDGETSSNSIAVTAVDPTVNKVPNAVASALPHSSGTVPLTVNFSSSGSGDSDGDIILYEWDFGDGSTSTEANPTHTYTVQGNFVSVLTVTDDEGAKDTASVGITVNAPVDNTTLFILNAEDDSVLYSLTDGLEIMKSDIGDTPLGIIYNADLEPGSVTFKLSGPLSQTKTEGPSAPYSLFGDIGVDIQGKSFPIGDYTLSTTTSSGMSQTVEFSIVNGPPANVAPVVVLSGDPDGNVPFKMNFTGSGSFDGDGTITNYSWDFGDGNTSSVTDPSHTYALGGDYTVTLTLTDDDGETSSNSIAVTAVDPHDVETVISFTLMDAVNQLELFDIQNNMSISSVEMENVNIKANTNPGIVGSVKFVLTGSVNRTWIETNAPYALYGDFDGVFIPTTIPIGSYTLEATPYSMGGAGGEIGQSLTVKFSVVQPASTSKSAEVSMNIFPNPASESITVSFDEPTTLVKIFIYDITGRLVQSLNMDASQDVGSYLLGVQDLPTGSYFVRTIDSEGKQSQQQMAIKR
ncbi:PKD domain-containing protein [Maribacter litoralis]|uniref:HYR domain-containing protein n=1 Tax=Maribacter litoralis TaxID=2059726 RepID=A0A653MFA3_9FLAO|nr:PKD domain-containing protein [Maribacter litoralis]VXB02779.1 HYR domain-containing protein [Maribacter litoralis]